MAFRRKAQSVVESVVRGSISAEDAVELLDGAARREYREHELPGAMRVPQIGSLVRGAGDAVHSVTIGPCVWCVRLVAMLVTGFVSLCVGAGVIFVLVRTLVWLGPHLW